MPRDTVSHAIDALGYYVAWHRWRIEVEQPMPSPQVEVAPTLWSQRAGPRASIGRGVGDLHGTGARRPRMR